MSSDFISQIKINSTLGNELITVQEAKDYIRVDTSADDNIISAMIVQSRIWAENFISKDIVPKNRTYYLRYVDDRFDLPFAPVDSVSTITIDGTATTDYELYGVDDSIVALNSLPSKEIKVTYITSGINNNLIKQAMLQLVSTFYDNRSDLKESNFIEIPTNVKSILQGFKTMFI